MNDTLPAITKIETTARVGEERRPAVRIWFENDTALQYVWDDEIGEIREENYAEGVVHESVTVGGSRESLSEWALESVAEYINVYRDDPDACKQDWTNIYEMLTFEEDDQ